MQGFFYVYVFAFFYIVQMIQRRWKFLERPDDQVVSSLSKALNVNEVIAGLLVQRGIDDYDKAYSFFRPKLEQLHSPFAMKDMDKAVLRIAMAMQRQERILIYGDYDVDGTTSVALMFSFFRDALHYQHIAFYIPDRYAEGYGLSYTGVDFADDNDFGLIITLDCGIRANEQIAYAGSKEIDIIVCDHHLPGDVLPEAEAILNPKQPACTYPYKELCGVGVGFKLVQGLAKKLGVSPQVTYSFLDLVAVGTSSDIVPITGENRILVYYGLQQLNENPRPGLKKLVENTGVQRVFNVEDVVFMVGPRINAAGRIKHGSGAVELLIARDNDPLIQEMGRMLDENNQERRELDRMMTEEAIQMVEADEGMKEKKALVLYHPQWHKGVIGIVASRLVERYYKPTIVLTGADNKISGSARSVRGFDVHHAIEKCSDCLENYGGHMYAAGLTIKPENRLMFTQKFEEEVENTIAGELVIPEILIDSLLDINMITVKFYSILRQFSPFGPVNMNPVFASHGLVAGQGSRIVGEKHLKLNLSPVNNRSFSVPAIGFNLAHLYDRVSSGESFSMAYTIGENTWNGKTTLQLDIKDIRFDI